MTTTETLDPESALLEPDLLTSNKLGKVSKITIVDTVGGYQLRVAMNSGREYYIVTQRERHKPRIYKNIAILIRYLKSNFPVSLLSFEFNDLPAPKKKRASKKKSTARKKVSRR